MSASSPLARIAARLRERLPESEGGFRFGTVIGRPCCITVYAQDGRAPGHLVCAGRRSWAIFAAEGDGVRAYWVGDEQEGRGWPERLADSLASAILAGTEPPP